MTSTSTVELFVQVAPEWGGWTDSVLDVRIVKITRRRPIRMEPGAHLVKVAMEVPHDRFLNQTVQVEAPAPAPVRAIS